MLYAVFTEFKASIVFFLPLKKWNVILTLINHTDLEHPERKEWKKSNHNRLSSILDTVIIINRPTLN